MASDSRTAEKLIILNNWTRGLLTRLYHCLKWKYTDPITKIPKRVLDKFQKKVLDPTEGIESTQGYEEFNGLASALEQECLFVYATVEDIINASDEMEAFFQSLSGTISTFGTGLSENADLTTRFLDVFTNYVKIHLLASRLTQAKTGVYIYLKSYHLLRRNEVESSARIKDYLFNVTKDPIKYLQKRATWHEVGRSLLECLQSMHFPYLLWSDASQIKQSQILEIMNKPMNLPRPLTNKELEDSLNGGIIDRYSTWCLLFFVVFPEHLQKEMIGRDILEACFRDRWCVCLFRDQVYDVRTAYYDTRCHKQMKVKIPYTTYLYKKATEDVVCQKHLELRLLYLETLKHYVDLIDTLPGVVPVKLPIILTALNLARAEIMWVFEHIEAATSDQCKKKLTLKGLFAAQTNRVTELMYYTQLVARKLTVSLKGSPMSRMNRLVSNYYREKLIMLYEDLAPLVGQVHGQIDRRASDMAGAIVTELAKVAQSGGQNIQILEGMRLSWYRTSVLLSQAGASSTNQNIQALKTCMNQVVVSSRYYDNLAKEVERCTSLSSLWFYRRHIAQFFNVILRVFKEPKMEAPYKDFIKVDTSQTRYMMVFLKVFEQAMNNVHKQNPAEREFIGEDSMKKAESYLISASSFVKDCCSSCVAGFSQLASSLSVENAILLNKQERNQRRGKEIKTNIVLPGAESHITNENRNDIRRLRYRMDAMGKVCAGFRETEKLLIFEHQLFPNAYLYDQLVDFFRKEVKKLLLDNQKRLYRPTICVQHLSHLLRTYHHIGAHLNIEIEHMIRKVMFDECNDENLGYVGQAVFPSQRTGVEQAKLIHDISTFYAGLIQSCVAPKSSRVYSPFEKGFYDLRQQNPSIQDFTTPNELQALCRLIGPGGVRVLDTEMIRRSVHCLEEIKTSILANMLVIDKGLDVSSSAAWSDSASQLRLLDELSDHSTLFGLFICFRTALRNALKVVAQEKTPFMARSVDLIHQRLQANNVVHTKFNQMALDFGILSPTSDIIMHNIVLQKLEDVQNQGGQAGHESAEQHRQFYRKAIPCLFGFVFVSNAWKNVEFNVPTGALSNNGMCIAHTLQILFDALTQTNMRKETAKELRVEFLRYASLTLLNMNTPQYRQQYSAHKSRDLLCFLDYFVLLDENVTVADLEQAGVPYAMIRSQYVRLYGAYNDINATEQIVDINEATEEL